MSNSVRHALTAFTAASALALAAGTATAASAPAPARANGPYCFFISQWRGTTSPAPNILYLGVSPNQVYKVTLSVGSPFLNDPTSHIISHVVGSSSICTSLDLQLYLSNGHGIETPLIATSLVRLTPEEVAAIPKKYLPTML